MIRCTGCRSLAANEQPLPSVCAACTSVHALDRIAWSTCSGAADSMRGQRDAHAHRCTPASQQDLVHPTANRKSVVQLRFHSPTRPSGSSTAMIRQRCAAQAIVATACMLCPAPTRFDNGQAGAPLKRRHCLIWQAPEPRLSPSPWHSPDAAGWRRCCAAWQPRSRCPQPLHTISCCSVGARWPQPAEAAGLPLPVASLRHLPRLQPLP